MKHADVKYRKDGMPCVQVECETYNAMLDVAMYGTEYVHKSIATHRLNIWRGPDFCIRYKCRIRHI